MDANLVMAMAPAGLGQDFCGPAKQRTCSEEPIGFTKFQAKVGKCPKQVWVTYTKHEVCLHRTNEVDEIFSEEPVGS